MPCCRVSTSHRGRAGGVRGRVASALSLSHLGRCTMRLCLPSPRRVVAVLCALAIAGVLAAAPSFAASKNGFTTGPTQTIQAELTGFSYFDNTPPGSADICCAIVHSKAGGTGTFTDPITTAVPGHSGKSMQTKTGTRLYIPKLRRYFVVEDSGASPKKLRRFDLWVGGQGHSRGSSDKCMDQVTGTTPVILNPGPGLAVGKVGQLTGSNGCAL